MFIKILIAIMIMSSKDPGFKGGSYLMSSKDTVDNMPVYVVIANKYWDQGTQG